MAANDDIKYITEQIQQALSVYIGDVPSVPGVITVTNSNGYVHPSLTDGVQWIGAPTPPPPQPYGGGTLEQLYGVKPIPAGLVGDIWYRTEKNALCIFDGESWKTVIKVETLKEAFQDFQGKATKEVKDMARFLDLELDDEEKLPKNIQDELITQAFRLKIYRLIQSLKEDKDGTKIPSNTNEEST